MKLTFNSTARRSVANAAARSLGGPQMPSPVIRIPPNPSRFTVSSPPNVMVPAALAVTCLVLLNGASCQSNLFHNFDTPLQVNWVRPVSSCFSQVIVISGGSCDENFCHPFAGGSLEGKDHA